MVRQKSLPFKRFLPNSWNVNLLRVEAISEAPLGWSVGWTLHWTLHWTLRYTLGWTLQWTLHPTLQCTLHWTLHPTLYWILQGTLHRALYRTLYPTLQWALHPTLGWTLHWTLQWTLGSRSAFASRGGAELGIVSPDTRIQSRGNSKSVTCTLSSPGRRLLTRTDTSSILCHRILENRVNQARRVIEEALAERSPCRVAPVPVVLVLLSLVLPLLRADEPTGTAALASEPVLHETAFCSTDGQTTVLLARFPDERGDYRTDTISRFPADSNWGEPSIAVSTENAVFVCWNRGGRISYSVKQPGMKWLGAFWVSAPCAPMSEPASHPRVEVADDRVICTWRGPKMDRTPGGVWRNWCSVPAGPTDWQVPVYLGDSTQVELMRDK